VLHFAISKVINAMDFTFFLHDASRWASGFVRKGQRVTKLLVSVRDAAEAQTALDSGVDLIDVKEPRKGSLGAATSDVIAEIAAVVSDRAPLSIACGELLETNHTAEYWSTDTRHTINFAKLGLADCGPLNDWPQRWRRVLATWPSSVAPVAVVYADWRTCQAPSPELVLKHGLSLGCRAVLVDTFDKAAGNLLTQMTIEELETLASQVRNHRLLYVLAGSLDEATIETVTPLKPDYIAVRGAVCRGGREGSVDGNKIRKIKSLLSPPSNVEANTSLHLPAER